MKGGIKCQNVVNVDVQNRVGVITIRHNTSKPAFVVGVLSHVDVIHIQIEEKRNSLKNSFKIY